MKKNICVCCKNIIKGRTKIHSYIKKIGNNTVNKVDLYCDDCFEQLNLEKSWHEHRKQEAARKRKHNK